MLLAVAAGASSPPIAIEEALLEAVWGAPGFLEVVWQLTVVVLAIWIVLVLIAAAVARRLGALADTAIGAVIAAVLWVVVDGFVGPLPEGTHVPLGFSIACAALASVRPHLGHPFRRPGRYLVLAVALVLVEQTTPSGSLLAMLISAVAADVTHLMLGAPLSQPDPAAVARSLQQLGVQIDTVSPRRKQRAGMVTFNGVETTDGGPHSIVVHPYGRDSRDTQLVTKLARSLWYRELRTILPRRIQQTEHEAFVTSRPASWTTRWPTSTTPGHPPTSTRLGCSATRRTPSPSTRGRSLATTSSNNGTCTPTRRTSNPRFPRPSPEPPRSCALTHLRASRWRPSTERSTPSRHRTPNAYCAPSEPHSP